MAMIFKGRNQVPFSYSCWGYTRGGGKTWHGGLDIVGLDSDRILMPDYHGKAISGRVIMATQVPEGSADPTWEWGWFVCVQLDAAQTPDTVNYLYFCHNARNLVTVGQAVRTGDELAVMGNTGNAKYADPPIAHCHFEVRAARSGAGLDPTAYAGIPNAAGTYGEAPVTVYPLSSDAIKMQIGPASAGDVNSIKALAESLGLGFAVDANGVMTVGPATSGDQLSVLTLASQLKLPYSEVGETPAGAEDKQYTATPLVDGLRLRPYPEANDDNCNEALTVLEKGKAYPLVQTRNKWAYVLTSDTAGGWACIEDEKETYLEIKET